MSATSFCRGHQIVYDADRRMWVWTDLLEPIGDGNRHCARCGRLPDEHGHDACLGVISGVTSACCGHGVDRGFVLANTLKDEQEAER